MVKHTYENSHENGGRKYIYIGTRMKGKPKTRWKDDINRDMEENNLIR
jgi:predicted transcriptional regulator